MTTTPDPARRPARARTRRRRSFGAIRALTSGRYQARYTGPDGIERTAPATFATRTAADDWLTGVQADLTRGLWHSPDRGAQTPADYLAGWLDSRVDLAPGTLALYRNTARRWITTRLGPRADWAPPSCATSPRHRPGVARRRHRSRERQCLPPQGTAHSEPHAVAPGAVEYLDDLIAAALRHPGACANDPYDARLAFRCGFFRCATTRACASNSSTTPECSKARDPSPPSHWRQKHAATPTKGHPATR